MSIVDVPSSATWCRRLALILALAGLALAGPLVPSRAVAAELGPSGLPLPRFVSLKASRINVREGPGEDYRIAWVYTKPGIPVEIVQEFENWRRIRDSDGALGWVFQSLLSGRRTVVVAPWEKGAPLPIRANPQPEAAISAYLEPGVMADLVACENGWCRLEDDRFSGWIQQDRLWGVYPDEEFD